jgi:hypothetical protein
VAYRWWWRRRQGLCITVQCCGHSSWPYPPKQTIIYYLCLALTILLIPSFIDLVLTILNHSSNYRPLLLFTLHTFCFLVSLHIRFQSETTLTFRRRSCRRDTVSRDTLVMAPQSLSLVLIFLTCTLAVHAMPASPSQTNTTQRSEPDTSHSSWSREEIFTFIGVVIAISGMIVTLLLSSSKLRQWLCCPFRCK